ncbi:MAG TPA: hypothetical protein VFB12_31775 [Ktedonobacteraceae bacterium]|nr:hypothetical protein [Ktedonobacteraceae bacterium]
MTGTTTKLTAGWSLRSRERVWERVEALFRVAQGHTMPFFGKDVGTKPEIT